ncbi:ABC transporter permease [Nocardioides sp. Soil796]|uniref:ABC transporter permease n=1 Tax=Nocardioides sp. Soil796 TaxID=1736412 RepID=UPI0009EBA3CF|nr:ABC transporter permease [Nocardioides sp. Soil796]
MSITTTHERRPLVPGRRAVSSERSRRLQRVATTTGLRLIVPALILAAWWTGSRAETAGLFVADPFETFTRVRTDFLAAGEGHAFLGDATWDHLFPGVWRALQGLGLAVVVGVGIGIALGRNRILMALFQPLIHLGRSLPSPALVGVFFFVFGTGDSPKVFLIAFSVVWPILFNTIDGVSSIGAARMQAAAVFKINRWDRLVHIVLPGAAPKIFAGMRTAMSLSLIIMIISELQKSQNGLGYLLIQSQRNFDYTGFWAVLVVLAILGVVMNIIFTIIERRVLAWHRGATQQHD